MNSQDRLDRLYDYILAIRNNEGSIELFKAHEADIKDLTPLDLFVLFDRLLKFDHPKEILPYLDKLVHIFSQGLLSKKKAYPENSILAYLHQENEAMKLKLNAIQTLLHEARFMINTAHLQPLFAELQFFTPHYQKIQNVLFPYLEKADERCKGLKIMWILQDQTIVCLKQICNKLTLTDQLDESLILLIGNYFFAAFGLIQKEELILFQVALDLLSQSDFQQIEIECSEFEACFISPLPHFVNITAENSDFLLKTESDQLSHEQLILILNALPLDITLIDEFDKVRYFNQSQDRLFPRSRAVLGRDVRNCHPIDSVHIVNEILAALKNGSRNEAKFWIHIKTHFVLIRYVALRNQKNDYKGCLEMTQEISEIQKLTGDRRLLDWD